MKNIGIITVLLGAVVLCIVGLSGMHSNTGLLIGGILIFAGLIAHLIIYRKGIDKEASK